ncbi:MAG: endonuclease III domain-containing protein [Candidatus Dadabacteria bacterium]|nr:endonuclease III domain-containing protein [Candidatus Dadabacteria bacterium]
MSGTGESERIRNFYSALYKRYGPQNWWPARTRLECAAGAILTQNTSWKNVERAIAALRESSMLSAEKLKSVPHGQLAALIRPCGYHNLKARRLINFIDFLFASYGGEMENMLAEDTNKLREELLSVNGIGQETADSILLYALGKPVFVVDNYSRRILSRHRLIPEDASYAKMQELFTQSLSADAEVFGEYHALIVKTGKLHCAKTPRCEGCPLEHDPHDPGINPL